MEMNEADYRLKKMMEKGWNIGIECKSSEREYALTYEASGSKLSQTFPFSCSIHAVGDTLDELIERLEDSISAYE